MNPGVDRDLLPEEVCRLLHELRDEDRTSNGQPVVKEQNLSLARKWLQRLLIDTLARMRHVEELCRLYQGKFALPRLRRDWPESGRPARPVSDRAFRHHDLLPPEKALAVSEGGVIALTSAELAQLLLNPLALWDLADMIDTTLPEWWCERMVAQGRELMTVEEGDSEASTLRDGPVSDLASARPA